jgi:hypothetical protein
MDGRGILRRVLSLCFANIGEAAITKIPLQRQSNALVPPNDCRVATQ